MIDKTGVRGQRSGVSLQLIATLKRALQSHLFHEFQEAGPQKWMGHTDFFDEWKGLFPVGEGRV